MICYGRSRPDTSSSRRCTGLKTLLSDHERCQEEVERGSHDVSGPWIEVTIIPADRLEIAHRKKGQHWAVRTPCCGKTRYWCAAERTGQRKTRFSCVEVKTRQGQTRILLCGGNVTSACIAVYRVSVWSVRHCLRTCRGSQLRVKLKASLDGHRMFMRSGGSCRVLSITSTMDIAPSSTIEKGSPRLRSTSSSSPESGMLILEVNKRMLTEEIATDVAFLLE